MLLLLLLLLCSLGVGFCSEHGLLLLLLLSPSCCRAMTLCRCCKAIWQQCSSL